MKTDLELRFLQKVRYDPVSECWLWTGACSRDYASLSFAGVSQVGAHRVAYRLYVGPIPEGKEIDHLCRVKHCVNPAHLEAVTHTENLAHRPMSPVHRTHCPSGHPYSGDNLCIKATGERSCRACGRDYYYRRKAKT